MSDQFIIRPRDAQTAEALKQELASLGIQAQHNYVRQKDTPRAEAPKEAVASRGMIQAPHYQKKQSLAFGASVSAGPFKVEITPEEILVLLENLGPAAVNALFNTLEKFKDRVTLLVNGERKDISELSS